MKDYLNNMYKAYYFFCIKDTKKLRFLRVNFKMVTSTEFESVNAAVKGQCVKPLHQLAINMAPQLGLEPRTP